MADPYMIPRYTVTVEELVASFRRVTERPLLYPGFEPDRKRTTPLPRPFATPKHPVEGLPCQSQIGISYTTKNPNFVEWRAACPWIPHSGDDRSGVVLYDGPTVIGGYTARGNQPRPPWLISVHPDYRGRGLATAAILEWFKAAPFLRLVGWPVNEIAAKAFVSAHKRYVEWEIAKGTAVPQRVIDSVRAG